MSNQRNRVTYRAAPRVAALFAAALIACGCTCSERKKPSDDPVRLKKRIDVPAVHLYAASKAALGAKDADPAFTAARDKALKLIAAGGDADIGTLVTTIGVGDLVALGRGVLATKGKGRAIVNGTHPEGAPLVPELLRLLGAPPGYIGLVDANMDHALLFLATGLLGLQAAAPVSIPEEVVLYEGWRTDATRLTVPGAGAPVHALRAYYYGTNDFCDLAVDDATRAEGATQKANLMLKGVGLFTEGAVDAKVQDLQLLLPALRILAAAGPAACYLARGDAASARPWMKRVIDAVKGTSLAGPRDRTLLEILRDCGGDAGEVARGIAALGTLPEISDPTAEAERRLADQYCRAPAQSKPELLKRFPFAEKIAAIARTAATNSRIIGALEKSRAYRAALGAATLAEKAVDTGKSVKGAVDALKGFFKNNDDKGGSGN